MAIDDKFSFESMFSCIRPGFPIARSLLMKLGTVSSFTL